MSITRSVIAVLAAVSAGVSLVGCSGSDAASDATSASLGPSSDASTPTSGGSSSDASSPTGPGVTTAAPDTTDTTAPDAPASDITSDSTGDSDDDPDGSAPPLVIDGPARVRPACDSLPTGVRDITLDAGGAAHDVRIYVPTEISSDPAPTVLDWHGLGSNGAEQAAFSGYETLAETEGFIVVHPTGVADGGVGPNSWELAQFDTPDRDDLAFADALIDLLVADWCGDPSRIYSTGMSNGGFFTSELVCNRSGRIAAAVSVAGTSHPDSCDPSRPVPYVSFHGTADDVVPFDGSGESTLSDVVDPDGFFGQVMPDEFAEFAADDGCDPQPTRVELTPEVISNDYTGCDDDVPMTFYEIVGGGHTWPGSPLAEQLGGLGFFTDDISATADGWAFMSQHSL